jgi:hypothetical protein
MTASNMAKLMIENIDILFKNWKPKTMYKKFPGEPIIKDSNAGAYNPVKRVWE